MTRVFMALFSALPLPLMLSGLLTDECLHAAPGRVRIDEGFHLRVRGETLTWAKIKAHDTQTLDHSKKSEFETRAEFHARRKAFGEEIARKYANVDIVADQGIADTMVYRADDKHFWFQVKSRFIAFYLPLVKLDNDYIDKVKVYSDSGQFYLWTARPKAFRLKQIGNDLILRIVWRRTDLTKTVGYYNTTMVSIMHRRTGHVYAQWGGKGE